MFAHLQLSKKDHVPTTGLTGSFGWEGNEAYQQQDVQEFLRVLFEAIEQSFELAGEDASFINRLYQGETSSYIKVFQCGTESSRKENFLDIQLPIKNEFGTGVINSSVPMALENWLKPDILDGDNKYYCSKCQEKTKAEKGLKITKTAKIVCISLNRFTLNYETF